MTELRKRHAQPRTTAPETDLDGRRLLQMVGGWRGMLDGGAPPLLFVATNAAVTARTDAATGLRAAVLVAAAVAAALIIIRLARRGPVRRAVGGTVGLAIAAALAATSGEARSFFAPGIVVDAAYALAFTGSVLIGRPLVGIIHRWLSGRADDAARGMRRAYAIATLGWAAVYATRVAVLGALYLHNEPALLALSKIALGWPLTLAGLFLTFAYLRRHSSSRLTGAARVA